MRDTRAEGEGVNNMPTLLHYLVHFLAKSGNDVVDFRDDLTHLEAAAKCKLLCMMHGYELRYSMKLKLYLNHSVSTNIVCHCKFAEREHHPG